MYYYKPLSRLAYMFSSTTTARNCLGLQTPHYKPKSIFTACDLSTRASCSHTYHTLVARLQNEAISYTSSTKRHVTGNYADITLALSSELQNITRIAMAQHATSCPRLRAVVLKDASDDVAVGLNTVHGPTDETSRVDAGNSLRSRGRMYLPVRRFVTFAAGEGISLWGARCIADASATP